MLPKLPKNLRDLVNDAISDGLRGRQVDALVCARGVQALDPAKPVPYLSIRVLPSAFEYFQDGKTGVVGMNCFVSIYPPRPGGFPIARVYNFPVYDLFEFARIRRDFEKRGFRLKPMSSDEFEAAVEANDYEQRITTYCEDFQGSTMSHDAENTQWYGQARALV
jgi:hypothetical protein